MSGKILTWAVWAALPALLLTDAACARQNSEERLRQVLEGARTLSADFKQASIDSQAKPHDVSYGKVYIRRPGRFRWDTTQPFVQNIILSGGKVWFYDPDLLQVTVKRVNAAIGSTPALLLSGEVSLEENFNIADQGSSEGYDWVRLTPKQEDSGFEYVTIAIEGERISGMELKDSLGQLTRIYFSNMQVNGPVDYNLFVFTAPPGVDVFEDQ